MLAVEPSLVYIPPVGPAQHQLLARSLYRCRCHCDCDATPRHERSLVFIARPTPCGTPRTHSFDAAFSLCARTCTKCTNAQPWPKRKRLVPATRFRSSGCMTNCTIRQKKNNKHHSTTSYGSHFNVSCTWPATYTAPFPVNPLSHARLIGFSARKPRTLLVTSCYVYRPSARYVGYRNMFVRDFFLTIRPPGHLIINLLLLP